MPDLPPALQCLCEASCFHTSTLLLPRYLHVLLVLTTRLWTTLAHLSCSLFATRMIGLLKFFGSLNITTSLIIQFGAVLLFDPAGAPDLKSWERQKPRSCPSTAKTLAHYSSALFRNHPRSHLWFIVHLVPTYMKVLDWADVFERFAYAITKSESATTYHLTLDKFDMIRCASRSGHFMRRPKAK